MPAIASHYLFGQEVYKQLIIKNRKDIIALIRKHKLDYNIGLQGPDPLFYYKPTSKSKVAEYGHQIHNEPAALFLRNAAKHIRQTKDIRAFVYAMGFVSHHVLDRETHETIEELAPNPPDHIKLETELDRELLLREILSRDAKHRQEKYLKKHREVSGFQIFQKEDPSTNLYMPMEFFSPKPSVRPEKIQRAKFITYEKNLEKSIAPLYPAMTERQLKTALDSFIRYTKILHSPTGTNAVVIGYLQNMLTQRDTFSSLAMTRKRYDSFVEPARKIVPIYDESSELAADMIINFHDSVRFYSKLADYFDQEFH